MKYKCTNIVWDTDGEQIDLPTTLIVDVDDVDELDDALSSATGFCHFGFDYEPFQTLDIERLKTLLYNAIEWMEQDDIYFDCETEQEKLERLENLLGITADEYKEIMKQ